VLGVACDRYQPPTAVVEQPLEAVPYLPVVLEWLEERDWRGGEISAAELVRRCPAVGGALAAIAARSLLALPIFRGELPLSMPDATVPIAGGQGGMMGGVHGGFNPNGGPVGGMAIARSSSEEEAGSWGNHRLWGVLLACDQQETRAWPDWQVRFLEQLAEQVAIAVQQAGLVQRLAHTNHQLEKMANQDGLTGIANRRYFDTSLHREWHRRPGRPLGILLGDVDAFKGYNDRYGHLAGDDCLRQVATAIARTLRRATDDVFRYGGEEFIILLPDTDLAGVIQVGGMVLEAVRSLQIDHIDSPALPYVTLSLGGISALPNPEKSPTELVDWADRALFQAKANGRNQLWVAERLGGPLAVVDGRSRGVSSGLCDPLRQCP
jgi:diguanylate cyclase (GGDEF)-like protein